MTWNKTCRAKRAQTKETIISPSKEFQREAAAIRTDPHLVLVAQVFLQVLQQSAVEVAQPTLVGLEITVSHHVEMKALGASACERASVAAEDDPLEVPGEFGAVHLDWNDALL